jgi:hypothetical protein
MIGVLGKHALSRPGAVAISDGEWPPRSKNTSSRPTSGRPSSSKVVITATRVLLSAGWTAAPYPT